MEDKTILKMREALKKLKKAHDVYVVCSEEQKLRLFDNCQHLIKELVEFSKDASFYEALLMYGEEFLLTEYGDEEEKIFGAFKQDMTMEELADVAEAEAKGILVWKKENGNLIPLITKGEAAAGPSSTPLLPTGVPQGDQATQLSLSAAPESVIKS